MKKQSRIYGIILSICLLASMLNCNVFAAGSGTATLSSPSGTVGATVTISGSFSTNSKIASAYAVLTYDPSGLQYTGGSSGVSGGSGSVKVFLDLVDSPAASTSFSINFKILKQGTFPVSFGNVEVVDDGDTNQMSIRTSSGSVTGKAATNNSGGGTTGNANNGGNTDSDKKDKNNKLRSLQIYPGTLTPAFSSGTTSYNVRVPEDTTEVTISATPQSSKANVTVSGGKNLKPGANTAQVIVVAENGSSMTYTINIMCGEGEQIQVGGNSYTINEEFTDEQIPTGFTRTKVTYNNRQYEGLTNSANNLQLMCLKNGETSTFFIYNQETQEFCNFVQIDISEGKYIIPLPLNGNIAEFEKYPVISLTVQKVTIDAWEVNEEFCIVYAINQDGEKVLYKYDNVDGTFQRYADIKIEDIEVETNGNKLLFPNEYYLYAIIGLGALCFILFVSMIYFIASRRARHEGRKRHAIKRQEKERIKAEKASLKEEKEIEKQREIAQKELERQQAAREKMEEKQRRIEEKQRLKEEKKQAKQKD